MRITRNQAIKFLETLFPVGETGVMTNPTRVFLEAHVGRVPEQIPLRGSDPDMQALRAVADVLRGVADHLEVAGADIPRAMSKVRAST